MSPPFVFAGAPSLRDVGGWMVGPERAVARSRVFRSGQIDCLTPTELDAVARLGVRTVIDLRRPDERAAAPGALRDLPGIAHHGIDLGHVGTMSDRELRERSELLRALARSRWPGSERELSAESRERLRSWALERRGVRQANGYWEMLDERSAELGRVVALLGREDTLPAIVHCAAGKDRTGVVIALLLSLLGVADVDISTDFSSSNADVELEDLANACGLGLHEAKALDNGDLRPFLGVAPDAIVLLLARVRDRFGSIDRFVRQRAAVSAEQLERLRSALLVDASG